MPLKKEMNAADYFKMLFDFRGIKNSEKKLL
jgi:hypothetical protein